MLTLSLPAWMRLDPRWFMELRARRRRQMGLPPGAPLFDLGFGDRPARCEFERSLMGWDELPVAGTV